MKYRTGQNIANGSSATITFTPPREHFLSSLMIHSETKACLYVEVVLYHDDEDIRADRGELLFGNWLRVSTKTDLIVLNKWVDNEKHSLKITFYNNTGGTVAVETTIYYYKQAFAQKNYYEKDRNQSIWLFYKQYKQTDAGGGSLNIRIRPAENEFFEILSYRVTVPNLGTATNFVVQELDSSIRSVNYLDSASIDSTWYDGPGLRVKSDDGSTTPGNLGILSPIIRYPNYLNFIGLSFAQNETMKIYLKAKIQKTIPTIYEISTGSIEEDTSFSGYSKVI